jgi:Tfp pilus assembly protein PilV
MGGFSLNIENKFPNFFLLGLKFCIFGKMETKNPKSGFGLIEVMLAAVVLAFMLVGLAYFQLGNREGVLRIRTRDVAQDIARQTLDSISALGLSSIRPTALNTDGAPDSFKVEHVWSGATGNIPVEYTVFIEVSENKATEPAAASPLQTMDSTFLTLSQPTDAPKEHIVNYDYARNVTVSVKWEFKKSPQSIQVSGVVR